jgi:hypothetical protein
MTGITCGVVIWSDKDRAIRTCGARATHDLIFRGDLLIGTCSRHNKRLNRAFPELESRAAA